MFAPQNNRNLAPQIRTGLLDRGLLDKIAELLLNKTDRFLRDLLFKQKFWMLFKSDQSFRQAIVTQTEIPIVTQIRQGLGRHD
jgi:hypothetical protein